MEKVFIRNRKGQKMAVTTEQPSGAVKGLVFVMHGLGGFKEQVHIETFAKAFLDNGYTTVRFDTTNTLGESDGDYADATITNYYEDLEDVINWAKTQPWYQEPFCLAGPSLGGICIAFYAEKYPEKVKALAPISTVVSGRLTTETSKHKAVASEWQKTGWLITESGSRPGTVKRLKWSHIEDRLKYDLLPEVKKLTMPVLMIVGEKDESTPVEHQKILYEALVSKKELHILPEVDHNFKINGKLSAETLETIRKIFNAWLKKL